MTESEYAVLNAKLDEALALLNQVRDAVGKCPVRLTHETIEAASSEAKDAYKGNTP